jgi:hypothetical protein
MPNAVQDVTSFLFDELPGVEKKKRVFLKRMASGCPVM